MGFGKTWLWDLVGPRLALEELRGPECCPSFHFLGTTPAGGTLLGHVMGGTLCPKNLSSPDPRRASLGLPRKERKGPRVGRAGGHLLQPGRGGDSSGISPPAAGALRTPGRWPRPRTLATPTRTLTPPLSDSGPRPPRHWLRP